MVREDTRKKFYDFAAGRNYFKIRDHRMSVHCVYFRQQKKVLQAHN